ncbi:MAG: ester cyclase [Microthrixaceae bacterium]
MDSHDDQRSPGDVMRAMVAAFDTGEVRDVDDFVDVSYLDHQGLPHIRPIEGADGFRLVVELARSGYQGLSVEIADLIEGSDRSAARLVWAGVRPSGEHDERETLEIVRVDSGRAVEHWGGHS